MIAPDRIYSQYRTKPKAVAWYKITRDVSADIATAYEDIRNSWNIDTQTGAQLDVIGRVVGAGFNYNSLGGVVTTENDALYRLLLKAQIAKNNGDASIRHIVQTMSTLLPSQIVEVEDLENMTFTIALFEPVTPEEVTLLTTFNLPPKPQGVRFNGYLPIEDTTFYGDSDIQYGDDSQYSYTFGGQ